MTIGGKMKAKVPIAIFALFAANDEKIRWFYTTFSPTLMLYHLSGRKGFTIKKQLLSTHRKHHPLYIFLIEHFHRAIQIPHSADYLAASQVTDYAPSIASPESALRRITNLDLLYTNHEHHKDLSGDRYLTRLHPAEVELASTVQLRCAEYLFIKRFFFQAFGALCVRSKEVIEAQVKGKKGAGLVRTMHAHELWLEKEYKWTVTRARKLVSGWKVLGFLDERRYMAWATDPPMLESVGLVEGDGNGDGVGIGEIYDDRVMGVHVKQEDAVKKHKGTPKKSAKVDSPKRRAGSVNGTPRGRGVSATGSVRSRRHASVMAADEDDDYVPGQ